MSNKEGNIVCAELGVPGIIRVVDNPGNHDLVNFTLVAIVQESTRIKVQDEWDPRKSEQIVQWADVVKTRFVMRLNEKSAIAEMKKEMDAADHKAQEAADKMTAAVKELDHLSDKLSIAESREHRLSSRLERVEGELRSARSRNQVMEKDLARLRQSLGEIRMQEILEMKS